MNPIGFFRSSDAYVKTAVSGIGIYLAAALIIFFAILVLSPSDVVFALILLIPAAIAIAALRYIRRWGFLIAGILSAFGFMALSADSDLFLTTPESFFDFILALFAMVGLGIAFLACLVGFIQYFRTTVGVEVHPAIANVLRGVVAVIVIAAGISLVLTIANTTKSVSAEERSGALEVVADDTKWSVDVLKANAGEPIRLFLKNDDPILHTFTIKDSARGIDIDVRMGPWSEKVVELEPLKEGIYGFICRIEGHEEDMTGAFTIN